jgi:5-methylcytosine-specific restriction enzyme B
MASNLIESVNTLEDAFNAIIQAYNPQDGEWYKNFQETVKTLHEDESISDQSLELLWYTRDNSVSSLKQGAPSWDEFERNKDALRTITLRLRNNVDTETYQWAIKELQQLKQDGKISKMYWALLNRVVAALAPDQCTTTVNEAYFAQVIYYLNQSFSLGIQMGTNWFEANQNYLAYLKANLPSMLTDDSLLISIISWHLYEEIKVVSDVQVTPSHNAQKTELKCPINLNQILFGPPGTGKTYHTIEAAVRAAEPEFVWQTRKELKAEYDRLVTEKRIRFVTFHQSYGYEEFVEGLSVRSVDGEAVYYERDGIFKQIVDDAMKHHMSKITASSDVFDSCWLQFLEQLASDEDGVKIKTKRTSFTITAIENGTIRFEKDKGASVHTLNVKTLKAIFDGERVINGGLNPYYSALITYLRSIAEKLPDTKIDRQNFVLVIDEINRGNISKIFGELITLLELSKRYGSDEALALTLPYSGDTFKIPDNLYIIGTMNTADRSLAMMDTALRRRFEFIEMMPDPSVLDGCEVSDINLESLLATLNARIEILYDREHTLGHAFFIPVKNLIDNGDQEGALMELVSVFQNKILPLLQEYFFDDWHKIRLVLGDNQRASNQQLIEEILLTGSQLTHLFGDEHHLDPYGEGIKQYKLKPFADDVWQDPNVYRLMYDHRQQKTGSVGNAQDNTAQANP